MNCNIIKKNEISSSLVNFTVNNGTIEERDVIFSLENQKVSKEYLFRNNFFAPDLNYGTDELIRAYLHFYVWEMAIKKNEPVSLFEDGVIFCKNFHEESRRIISKLHPDWDVLLWGHDSDIIFGLGDGRMPIVGYFTNKSPNADLERFSGRNVASSAFQLLEASGVIGYSVSAKGARALLRQCTPIKNSVDLFKPSGKYVKNASIGHVMGCNYVNMQSYSCIPPLCIKK